MNYAKFNQGFLRIIRKIAKKESIPIDYAKNGLIWDGRFYEISALEMQEIEAIYGESAIELVSELIIKGTNNA